MTKSDAVRRISLAGAWAKIVRAKQQLHHVAQEVSSLVEAGHYKIIGENQSERQRYAFKLVGPPVPDRIAVLAGEIIHHLRCCFDHVIWALAQENGIPNKRITFPVCDTAEKFKTAIKNGAMNGVSNSKMLLIETIQPYRTTNPENSIIQAIHDLDIVDKHRILVIVSHTLVMGNMLKITRNDAPPASEFGIELPPPGGYPWAIEDGVEVHWVPLRGGPNPGFEMET
ncbi:MAG: hypothetical protein IT555_07945, partial [Acetobacteraceae bacterium]|nr:hypothetical protein [Acetobacteraceae bacterium]